MRDLVAEARRQPPHPLLGVVLGAGAGLLGAALLATQTPVRALAALAVLGGLLILTVPHVAVYALVGATIVQWPADLIKYAGVAVAGAVGLWALATRRPLVPRDRLFAILALLSGLVLIGALRVGEAGATSVAASYLSFLGFYWLLSTAATAPRVVRHVAAAMLWSGFLLAAIGIVQFRYHFIWPASTLVNSYHATVLGVSDAADLAVLQAWEGVFRVESLAGTPDFFGLSMQVLLPFAFFWMLRRRTTGGRLVGAVLLATLALALVLSLTRGAMLTTAMITVPLLAVKFGLRRSVPYLVAGVLLVGTLGAVWEPLQSRALSAWGEWASSDPTTAGGWRREMIGVGLHMFADHFWVGVGPGQHRNFLPAYAPSTLLVVPDTDSLLPIHNAYLALAIETGVGGLLLLLLLIALAWRRLRRLQRAFRAGGQTALLDLAHAAEVAWIGLTVNVAMYPQLDKYRYFWLLLAFIGCLSRIADDEAERAPPAPAQQGHLQRGTVARG
jgi:O-antigen ligase